MHTSDGRADDDNPALDPAALARAEAALAALADSYLGWAAADLLRLEAALARLRAEPGPESLRALFRIAHDMKGQASTFGYPLITDFANRLCRRIEADPADIPLMARLVAAIGAVLTGRLADDGGEAGRRLLADLDQDAV